LLNNSLLLPHQRNAQAVTQVWFIIIQVYYKFTGKPYLTRIRSPNLRTVRTRIQTHAGEIAIPVTLYQRMCTGNPHERVTHTLLFLINTADFITPHTASIQYKKSRAIARRTARDAAVNFDT